MTASLRTQLAQMEVLPGRPWENTERMLSLIMSAQKESVDLLVFPEMAIPGYLIGDEWEHEAFLKECEQCGMELCAAARNITIILGNVGLDWQKKNEGGRVRKYNALFAATDGQFAKPDNSPYDFVPKTLHPNYRQFDDSRHFFDLRKLAAELDQSV